MSNKTKKNKKIFPLIIASILFVISSTIVLVYFIDMFKSSSLDSKLSSIKNYTIADFDESDVLENNSNNITNVIVEEQPEEYYTEYLPGVSELLEINSDLTGWIKIPGTKVDNPIVQSDDNGYYLTHNFDGKKNEAIKLLSKYKKTLLPYQKCDNLVLYGHNQMNGSMFGTLTNYKKDPLFVAEAPIIYLDTNYVQSQYIIFACFVINTDEKHDDEPVFPYHEYIDFDDTYSFDYWINEIKRRSLIGSEIETLETDKYVTLSTCAVEFDNARFVVIGRKIRPGEQLTTGYYKNPNAYFPDIWYKINGNNYRY